MSVTIQCKKDQIEVIDTEISNDWITTTEAMSILKRGRKSIFDLAKAGLLTLNRPGRCIAKFRRSEVVEMARKQGLRVG